MKVISLIRVALASLIIYSCNPNAGKELIIETVKLNATFNNTSETMTLGDTLIINLKLPDTITSNLRTQTVQSLQRGFYAMYINKVDTINRRATLIQPPVYWLTKGTKEGVFSFVMNTNVKPYEVIINFKPQEKGLYYLEVIAQPGVLKINGGNESNFIINFLAIDKHLNLVSTYFGGQPWLDEATQRNIEGFGVYAFRVN